MRRWEAAPTVDWARCAAGSFPAAAASETALLPVLIRVREELWPMDSEELPSGWQQPEAQETDRWAEDRFVRLRPEPEAARLRGRQHEHAATALRLAGAAGFRPPV